MTVTKSTLHASMSATPQVPPRGPVSAYLLDHLTQPVHDLPAAPEVAGDAVAGEDLPLSLYLLYELSYRGVDGVDERWEHHPDVVRLRAALEAGFERQMRDLVGPAGDIEADITAFLQSLTGGDDGPSLSGYVEEQATLDQFREQAVHRSAWQLKEADPHSWAIPRLGGKPKAALVEIQMDEYGQGVEQDIHAELYALTMRRLGLSGGYNHYLDLLPGLTLSTVNLVSMFGLHRRWLGAVIGHLAVFEMTSVSTMGAYAAALRRLDFDPWTALFYDTHVVADAHHQTVAATDLAQGLIEQDPRRQTDIVFGARAIGAVEAELTRHVLHCWEAGETSLLQALPDLPVAPGQLADLAPADDPRRHEI